MKEAVPSYEPEVIERFAAQLERRARAVRRGFTAGGLLLGALFGSFPLTSFGNAWPIPHIFGFTTLLVGAGVGALIGWVVGEGRAAMYRLHAQTTLCQLHAQRTTLAIWRLLKSAPSPSRARDFARALDPDPEPERSRSRSRARSRAELGFPSLPEPAVPSRAARSAARRLAGVEPDPSFAPASCSRPRPRLPAPALPDPTAHRRARSQAPLRPPARLGACLRPGALSAPPPDRTETPGPVSGSNDGGRTAARRYARPAGLSAAAQRLETQEGRASDGLLSGVRQLSLHQTGPQGPDLPMGDAIWAASAATTTPCSAFPRRRPRDGPAHRRQARAPPERAHIAGECTTGARAPSTAASGGRALRAALSGRPT